ncbi:hypothetical protein AOL_s00080g431 [Orbilia oligospora ATCC 24927]|uniref:Uncharacterized protein n=1 Tax=Arthrobotrys oligospora (strain ATCC 24927 / CBS 115.81 / DSM 1491) TaxID=756982 RepID=G1XF46_ARTOA|nr:hypothetical protein AOL_s00080g431 [Orbilia oligospora ATCC 24927]EGX48306.1 hypothetical protein AOL_s00080g431 [Orbilia oligospora ATCC 24927]
MTYRWQKSETEGGSETDSELDLEDKGCEDIQTSTKLSETEITKLLMEKNYLKTERNILIIENDGRRLRKNHLILERINLTTEREGLTMETSGLRAEIDFLTAEKDRFWHSQKKSFQSLTPEARKQKKEADLAKSVRGEPVQSTGTTQSAIENNAKVAADHTPVKIDGSSR